MLNTTPYHIYVHVPWCRSKCPYCDFTVYVDRTPAFETWTKKVLSDIDWTYTQANFPAEGPTTLYFGGGTPSLLPLEHIEKIISQVTTTNTSEITVEVNPGDVSPDNLRSYRSMGVTRLSLGVQSFNRQHLKRLGRGTTPKDVHQLIAWVKNSGFDSWSMDLMFGLPNQTFEDLERDVETMLELNPPHVSLYGLTYKEGTPLYKALQKGTLHEIQEGLWIQQFNHITRSLQNAGFMRYEVSNFCRPPHQAQHNEGIWKNQPYIGVGPSAHGFWTDGRRTQYPKNWANWLSDLPTIEIPTPEQRVIDWLITAIRHREGICLTTLGRMGYTLDIPVHITKHPIFTTGVAITKDRCCLSDNGWVVVDWITEILVEALTPTPS